MKKLLFILGILFVSPLTAQEVYLPVLCLKKNELIKALNGFSEKPLITGFSSRLDEKGEVELLEFIIFVNPDTKSYTVVEIHEKDKFCVLSAGIDFKPHSTNKRDGRPGI